MKEVLSWLSSNYEFVVLIAACILDLVLFLFGVFKKKEPILNVVYQKLPEFINDAESLGKSGEEKLHYVLERAILLLCHGYGYVYEDINKSMKKRIEYAIEAILSTPQKKGK